jgi:predicted NodU family carbamoyl transferase
MPWHLHQQAAFLSKDPSEIVFALKEERQKNYNGQVKVYSS